MSLAGARHVPVAYIEAMCGRYTLTRPEEVLEALFGDSVVGGSALSARFNIAPTQDVPVVRWQEGPELALLRWGLVPSWTKPDQRLPTLINARCETIHEKPSFRAAFRARRCVLLADGFYEWERANGQRLPWLFRRKDGSGFGMAGIWERWGRGDEGVESVAIVTTQANEVVERVHQRMPVMLQKDDVMGWLNPARGASASLLGSALELTAHRVSTAVNHATASGDSLVVPLD